MDTSKMRLAVKCTALALVGFVAVAAANVQASTIFAYIPNQGNSTASVMNTSLQTQTTLIPGMGTPYSAAVAPNGSVAYVADFTGNRIFPINTTTNVAGAAITVGTSPVNVTFSSDSTKAYVSNYNANSISIVDVVGGVVSSTVTTVCPAGAANPIQSIFNGTKLLIVCNGATSKVVSMDTASGNALAPLAVVGNTAYNIAISTASGFGYVTNYGGGNLSKFDLTTGATTTLATTGVSNPLGIAVTPDGSKIYVANYGGNNLIVMTPSGVVTTTLNLGGSLAGIGMSSSGGVIYVPKRGLAAGIKVINTTTDTVTNTIANPGADAEVIWGDFLGNVAAPPAPNNAPTAGSVATSGSAVVGAVLTGSYVYADTESDPEGTSTFKWYSDTASTGATKVAIGGATASTYTVQAGDLGKFLFFCVTPVATSGTSPGAETCASATAAVTANQAPTATGVTQSGSAVVGSQLTGSYTYADTESDPQGVSTFKWYSDSGSSGATKAAIGGATSSTYTVQGGDLGRFLFFCVTPVATSGTTAGAETCSSASSAVVAANQAPTASNVTESGSAVVGSQLTGGYTYDDANGDPQGASTFKWYSDSSASGATKAAIGGATGLTYIIQSGNLGKFLFFCVTPVASSGVLTGAETCSSASAAVAANQAPTASNVAVSGLAFVGTQLTGSYTYADAENNPQGTSTFRWYSDVSSGGSTKAPIGGAISTTYTPQAGDAGRFLFFCVTPVATSGTLTGVETCSGATAAVGSAAVTYTAPSATGSGSITASFVGGGPTCSYSVSQLIPTSGNPASPPTAPAGFTFPQGLFDFTTSGCTPGSTITMTITYPQPLPAGTQYMKYGPTPTDGSNHWYVMPANISGNLVSFTITDGGLGDDDLAANGTIVDQGGPAVPDATAIMAPIPTLSSLGLGILGSFLALSSIVVLRRRGM